MHRIVMHHTGGTHTPSTLDLSHYHFVIDGAGRVHKGKFPVSANAPGSSMAAGTYAAHTKGLNTGAVGVSLAAMAGAEWGNPRGSTKHPVTAAQVDALIRLCAKLCVEYGISPRRDTVLSHAEVEGTLGVKQRGKWDFDYDPLFLTASRDPYAIGDAMRLGVSRALLGVREAPKPIGPYVHPLRRGASGNAVVAVQKRLGLNPDGLFGPTTAAAVRAFQARHELLPDGIVGAVTLAAMGL